MKMTKFIDFKPEGVSGGEMGRGRKEGERERERVGEIKRRGRK